MDKSDVRSRWPDPGNSDAANSWPTLVQVSESTGSESARPAGSPRVGRSLAFNLALYTLARLVLVAVITVVIVLVAQLVDVQVPLVVAILFALIIAMPLSLTLFKGLRARVNADIAAVDAKRRQDKAQLRARLRGEGDDAS
ncbi:DUF4229 domain-containing protein [Nocardia farcinica]|nr:DUF4229 domain-containing protein [Nocardia farcinica]